jgi:hypothetical protein
MPKISKGTSKTYMLKYIADHNLQINTKQKKADLYTALAKAGHATKSGQKGHGRGLARKSKGKEVDKFEKARKNLREYVTGRGGANQARGGFGTASAAPMGKSAKATAERLKLFRQYTGKKVTFSNYEGEATIVGGNVGEFGLKVGDRVIPMAKTWKPIWAPTQTGTLTWMKKFGEPPGKKKTVGAGKRGSGQGVGLEKNIKIDPRAIAIPKKVSKEDFDKARLDLTRILAQYKN